MSVLRNDLSDRRWWKHLTSLCWHFSMSSEAKMLCTVWRGKRKDFCHNPVILLLKLMAKALCWDFVCSSTSKGMKWGCLIETQVMQLGNLCSRGLHPFLMPILCLLHRSVFTMQPCATLSHKPRREDWGKSIQIEVRPSERCLGFINRSINNTFLLLLVLWPLICNRVLWA